MEMARGTLQVKALHHLCIPALSVSQEHVVCKCVCVLFLDGFECLHCVSGWQKEIWIFTEGLLLQFQYFGYLM